MLRNTEKIKLLYACDLDHDPMTLVLKLDPDFMFAYLHAKNKVNRPKGSKVMALTDRHSEMRETFTYGNYGSQ